jgi:hypothetical protein
MKYAWNDALAAYDRELPMLRALRQEYHGYVLERLNAAKTLLTTELRGRATFEADSDDGVGAELCLVGGRAVTGLQCQVWPSADEGTEPGLLHWAILVSTRLPKEFGFSGRYVAAARHGAGAIGEPSQDEAPARAHGSSGHACIGWGRLRLDDPDLPRAAADAFRAILPAMERAADAVLALRTS